MIFLHDVLNYVLPCWSFTSYFCISKLLENDFFTNTKKMKLSLSLSVWSDFMQMSLLHISVFMGPPNHCHFFHVCNGVWKLPCIRCSRCPHCKYLKLLHPNKVWDLFSICNVNYAYHFYFQNQIESVMKVSDVEFGLLTSLYSWPNVVLPVVGGYLIDRVFGLRIASVIFIAFCILGRLLIYLILSQ